MVSLAAAWRLTRADDGSPQPVTRFVLASPEGVAPRGAGAGRHLLALSPQGTHLVYWANNQLYVRAMDSLEQAKPIPGTEGAREPFFSAAGQWIGFFQGQLKKVSVRGGAVMRVADANLGYGANWEADNQVFFGLGPEGIWRVPSTGGTPEKVIAVKDGEEAHGPQELPDGSILYTLRPKGTTSWDDAQIVVEPRGGARTVLIRGGRDARYLRTGHLIYGVNGVLYAVPFDASSHTIRGGAVPVAEGVMDADIRTGAMHYSVSADDGSLAYVIGASSERATLVFIDRQGRPMSLPGDPLDYARPRISPDGTRVALEVGAGDNRNLRIYDLARFTLTRLTADSLRAARYALWTRDGQRVVFFSDSDGGGLFSQAADGTGTTTRLTTSAAEQMPYAWSVDGRTLVFEQGTTGTLNTIGLYLLPLEGPRIATPLLRSTGDNQPALSPDGRWMAYTEQTLGLYVRPFPDVEKGRFLISGAGSSPLWSRDGRELFFIARGQAMAVSVETEPMFRAGTPRPMFDLGPYYRSADGLFTRQWDIDAAGGKFLVLKPGDAAVATDAATRPQLVVVRNWFEELKRLSPTR